MSSLCRVIVFSGAGISRESGLRTFRGENGMWNGYRIESVCSARAWELFPENVVWFYDERRREVLGAEPNAAHLAVAELARTEGFTVTKASPSPWWPRTSTTCTNARVPRVYSTFKARS